VDKLAVERSRLAALVNAPWEIYFWRYWPGVLNGMRQRERECNWRQTWPEARHKPMTTYGGRAFGAE
jgi:F420-0:gamma-glutamyl ligase-like protein